MEIKDNLYGSFELKEEVLINLINSKAINRLKDISQFGIPKEYYHKLGFSRYDHSIGVSLFLRKLKASLEEQVAGLLHDASHTPFSHVIDWAIGDPTKEDYQDTHHFSFLSSSEIPVILKKYGLNFNSIINYKNFKLLERKSPKLCADRIDYCLRELYLKENDRYKVTSILENIGVKKNQIVFFDKENAKIFGESYMNLQREHWGGDEARTRYYILSEVLNEAFRKNLICIQDLRGTETPLLETLLKSNNELILSKLNLLKNGFFIIENENGIELKKKFRYIDPEVSVNRHYLPLSKLSKDYRNFLEFEKHRNNKLRKINIIPF